MISLMKSSKELGIATTLLFMILKNFLESRQVSLTKLMVLVLTCPSKLVCESRKFFILVLLDSQNSCKNLKDLHKANSKLSSV